MRYRFEIKASYYIWSVVTFSVIYNTPRFFEWQTYSEAIQRPCLSELYKGETFKNNLLKGDSNQKRLFHSICISALEEMGEIYSSYFGVLSHDFIWLSPKVFSEKINALWLEPPSPNCRNIQKFMSGSSHIRNVLIGVEYWNCCRTLNVYLLFAILLGHITSKVNYRLETYKLASSEVTNM